MSPARITPDGAHAFREKSSSPEAEFSGLFKIDINMCFSLGDTLDEAIRNIQTAVELYYDGENITAPPQASKIEDLVKSDLYTKDGFWVLADIDFPFLSSKTVRINITLPECKLSLIDKAAKARGLSRSAFLAECAEHAV